MSDKHSQQSIDDDFQFHRFIKFGKDFTQIAYSLPGKVRRLRHYSKAIKGLFTWRWGTSDR